MIIVGIILLCYMLIKLNKDNIYRYLPSIVTFFISPDTLQKIVQKMFNEIKDLLDDGKRNKSTKGEE